MIYDILVIGSGPAGITASIYAARAQKSVLVIEKDAFGGLITHSPKIENYPGFNTISGLDLADKFIAQAMDLGVNFEFDNILSLKKDINFIATGENNSYEAKTVIIATGSKHRLLGLDKEQDLTGKGVSYCAVCDGPFFTGRNVIIVGGGNSALQEAILLSGYCNHVTIVQNLSFLTGEAASVSKVNEIENISVYFNKRVVKLNGDSNLQSIDVIDDTTNELMTLKTDGLFVAIGQVADNESFKDLCDLNNNGFIITNELCETKIEGLFAAGDCRDKRIRQISTAISDGTICAIRAIDYIDKLK